jgi:putative ubiquitin-RnfH superfamily antitoxin RatB of RatAB toxin-antitoxin module
MAERMPRVTVSWSPAPRQVLEWLVELPEGATVRDAVLASGWSQACPGTEPGDLGIWGRRCAPDVAVRDGDRVEVYRPLRVDPKRARRERFRKQGARAAGLFAQRRPGAKPGY